MPAGAAPCQRGRTRRRIAHAILFAAEPDTEGEVRQLIDQALSGQMEFPDGFTTPWRLRTSWASEVSAEETDPAERLIRS